MGRPGRHPVVRRVDSAIRVQPRGPGLSSRGDLPLLHRVWRCRDPGQVRRISEPILPGLLTLAAALRLTLLATLASCATPSAPGPALTFTDATVRSVAHTVDGPIDQYRYDLTIGQTAAVVLDRQPQVENQRQLPSGTAADAATELSRVFPSLRASAASIEAVPNAAGTAYVHYADDAANTQHCGYFIENVRTVGYACRRLPLTAQAAADLRADVRTLLQGMVFAR